MLSIVTKPLWSFKNHLHCLFFVCVCDSNPVDLHLPLSMIDPDIRSTILPQMDIQVEIYDVKQSDRNKIYEVKQPWWKRPSVPDESSHELSTKNISRLMYV